jgi:hypothetical protein
VAKTQNKALLAHRYKLKRSGVKRVEVRVHKDDVTLIRSVAMALSDPVRNTAARTLLRSRFGKLSSDNLKDYLASAPLEGIDLTRPRDLGRNVKL